MRPARARTLQTFGVAVLALVAVRPIEPLEVALDWAVAPARLMAELSAPVADLQGRELLAAGPERRARELAEREGHARLEERVLRSADPARPDLARRATRAVRAEVVERLARDRDRVLVRVEDPGPVRGDYPVVSGDTYVGRVDLEATRRRSLPDDLLVVRLVTGEDFRVGAAVAADQDGEACRMVVGGLLPRAAVRLAVHDPSRRRSAAGTVAVSEAAGDGDGALANGFLLGELERVAPDELGSGPGAAARGSVPGVVPGLDYATGLHQVLVLLPPEAAAPRRVEGPSVLADGRWIAARLFVRGEPSPWRAGRKLALGRWHGLEDGAALRSGARFVGRLERAGLFTSDVSLVADQGLRVPALALLELEGGEERLHVLGELVSLGLEPDGRVRLRWPATLPLDERLGPRVPAELWTSSGEAGVPRGLLIGRTELPVGPGPHALVVELPPGAAEPKGLAVRWRPPAERGGAGGTR